MKEKSLVAVFQLADQRYTATGKGELFTQERIPVTQWIFLASSLVNITPSKWYDDILAIFCNFDHKVQKMLVIKGLKNF